MLSNEKNSLNLERSSRIQMLESIINMLSHESMVRTPCPTVKNLFFDKEPKNRKNLKKINQKNIENNMNSIQKKKIQKYRLPTIKSVIKNSLNNEFLSSDNPNYKYQPKIIKSNINYSFNSFNNYSQTLYNQTNHNNINGFNGMHLNNKKVDNNSLVIKDNISHNSKNNLLGNTINGNNAFAKMNNGNDINENNYTPPIINKKSVDLNDLYNEYIENVSII
jgi:hypothetical protein